VRCVIDYDEQSRSPGDDFRASVQAPDQYVLGVTGHFGVATMRLAEVAADAWLTDVGEGYLVTGRFECGTGDAGDSASSFVTEAGQTFQVANNPAGTTIGCAIQALAYPVRLATDGVGPAAIPLGHLPLVIRRPVGVAQPPRSGPSLRCLRGRREWPGATPGSVGRAIRFSSRPEHVLVE
jgi:hypothetical protein